jgi:hypothetical protein
MAGDAIPPARAPVRVRARARAFTHIRHLCTPSTPAAVRTTRPRWRMQFKSDGHQTARSKVNGGCVFPRVCREHRRCSREDRYAALFHIARRDGEIARRENFIRARDWKELSPSSSSSSSSSAVAAGVRNRRYVKLSLYLADVEEGCPPFPERFIEFPVSEHRERDEKERRSAAARQKVGACKGRDRARSATREIN